MIKMLQLSCYNFLIIKISCLYMKKKNKKQYKINHGKTCYVTKIFRHSKI